MKRLVFSAMALLCAVALQAQSGHSVYTLAENCTITLSPIQTEYAVGDEVTVTITPTEGAVFDPDMDFEIYVECTEQEYNDNIANARRFDVFKARRKAGLRRAPASHFAYRLEIYSLDDGDYDYGDIEAQGDGSYTCTFNMPARNVEIEASCTLSDTPFAINVTQADNGSTSVSSASAVVGSTVTITATPAEGYEVDEVNVWERDGAFEDIMSYTPVDATHFTFNMPANPVHVKVTYKKIVETGIKSIDNSSNYNLQSEDDTWYTLDGRLVVGKPATKGVYINNGRKVVIP